MMDHAYIEEQQIVDRYVAGTLPAEEMERFENHYLSCPECLDRLQLAESLNRGFKRMAGQDAAVLATARQLAVVAWLARLGRARQAGVLVMTLVAFAILPGVVELRRASDHGQEVAQVRSTLKHERQHSAEESRRATDAEKRLEASLAAQQEANARAGKKLAEAQKPQKNFSVLQLDRTRDGGPEAEPASQLRLAASVPLVDVILPVDEPYSATYRAVLQDVRHRELWRVEGLRPNGDSELTLSLPASFLTPGDYTFKVDGGGKSSSLRYSFRVKRPS